MGIDGAEGVILNRFRELVSSRVGRL